MRGGNDAQHCLGLVSEQSKYSLACRYAELGGASPRAAQYGVGVIPWSPLDRGFLGGVLDANDGDRRASDNMKQRIAGNRGQLEKWEGLCKELGEKLPADVAARLWLLQNAAVTAPIIGPRTMDQLHSGSLRALEIKLSAETLAKLDVIFPSLRAPSLGDGGNHPYRNEAPGGLRVVITG